MRKRQRFLLKPRRKALLRQPDEPAHPLNVGIVGQNLVRRDGQGRWMLEVARALAERGHRVTVYSFTLDKDVAQHPSVHWISIPTFRAPQLLIDAWMILCATIKVRKGMHDVTCILGPCVFPRSPYAYFAAFSNGAWRRTWKLEGPTPDAYRRLYGRIHVWLEQRSVGRAAALVAMSEITASELKGCSDPNALVAISPGGVDEDEFGPASPEQRRVARELLAIPEDAFVLTMIGEYATGRKGLDRLAEAIASDPDKREIVLVRGWGPKQKALARLRALGVEDKFRLLDPGPAQEVLAAADAVIVPSAYEPFSLVALEAAASHLPLILSDRVGAGQHLVPEGAAISVDPLSSIDIRSAIERLKDRDAAREMGEKGGSVSRKMTWPSVSSAAVGAVELTAGVSPGSN